MSKVYLHDEATDIQVMDSGNPHFPVRLTTQPALTLSPAEFRAVIEGGLEWVLSNAGFSLLNSEVDTLKRAIRIVRGR